MLLLGEEAQNLPLSLLQPQTMSTEGKNDAMKLPENYNFP